MPQTLAAQATTVAAQERELLTLDAALARAGIVDSADEPPDNPRLIGPRAEADAARERPRVPITFATTVGALAAFVLVSLSTLVTGDRIVPKVSSPGLFYLCMALDGFAIAGIFVAFSIAPRYITGAEVSLCSLLETVLGPLWVFLIYNERPGPFTLAGGLLLIGALFVHELLAAREAVQRRERERQGAAASLRAMEGLVGDAKSPDTTLSDATGDGALSELPSEKTVSVAADTSSLDFSVAANSV